MWPLLLVFIFRYLTSNKPRRFLSKAYKNFGYVALLQHTFKQKHKHKNLKTVNPSSSYA